MKKAEILAPVGKPENLEAALSAGCDAIYCALRKFGARALADNFTLEQMRDVIKRCHSVHVKVYVTMNTLLFESEMEDAYAQARQLHEMGVDALIVQDLGLIHLLSKRLPDLRLHASTQLSVTRPDQIEQLKKLGIKRVVLARECTIEQIRNCVDTGMEVEVFVHGALCICYSGQCLFSALTYQRSGNRGLCAQPCRMPYTLYQDGKPVKTKGKYLLSPKDVSLIEKARELQKMGVVSFKIEGRMKSREYMASAVQALKTVLEEKTLSHRQKNDLQVTFNRGFSLGHAYHEKGDDLMNTKAGNHRGLYIGKVIGSKKNKVRIRLQEPLESGDAIRFVKRHFEFGCYVNETERLHDDLVEVKVAQPIPEGAGVYKTIDNALQKEVSQTIRLHPRKLPVSCHLACKGIGHPLTCTLSDGKRSVCVQSEEMAADPVNRTTDAKILRRQFSKTGNSFVEMADFSFDLKEDVYFTLSACNALRKKAADALYDKLTQTAAIRELPYEEELDPITIESEVYTSFSSKSEVADLRFNVTNSYALACLLQAGKKGAILSLECTDRDMIDLLNAFKARYGFAAPVQIFVYGKRRLMIMDHCPVNTALKDGTRKGCALCHRHRFTLKGKDGHTYTLSGDPSCRMRIFEENAWDQTARIERYRQFGIYAFAVFFLDESEEKRAEICRILKGQKVE